MKKARIAVFVSGGGTNLQALLDAEKSGIIKSGKISLVVSNNSSAYALERAKNAGISSAVVLKKELGSQEAFENKIKELLSENEIDIIAEDDSFLVFVEVKTRSVQHEGSSLYGSPARAVDSKKRSNTVKAAIDYLRINYTEKQPRIDVIEVYMKERNNENSIHPQILSINHIRDAFDSRGRKH